MSDARLLALALVFAPLSLMSFGGGQAIIATMAPSGPATFQPMSAAISVLGPGAARDSAKKSTNSGPVIQ